MLGDNVTKCPEDRCECLGSDDCCYECDHKDYCDQKCEDKACRMLMLSRRLGIIKEERKRLAGRR